jgi:hypothetical protein
MRRYTARMEFFSVAEEVEKLLDQGASYVLAFEKLQHEKKITMSYYTFYSYARKGTHFKQRSIKSVSTPAQDQSIKSETGPNKGPVFAGFRKEKSITEMLHSSPEEQEKLFFKD